ncbi:MAG: hypothetical protein DMF85_17600 [Acidobacteria bacterium]|nr:MAG: hypothetical protein DMF85_17600 [Acidobacteriota bacterium]
MRQFEAPLTAPILFAAEDPPLDEKVELLARDAGLKRRLLGLGLTRSRFAQDEAVLHEHPRDRRNLGHAAVVEPRDDLRRLTALDERAIDQRLALVPSALIQLAAEQAEQCRIHRGRRLRRSRRSGGDPFDDALTDRPFPFGRAVVKEMASGLRDHRDRLRDRHRLEPVVVVIDRANERLEAGHLRKKVFAEAEEDLEHAGPEQIFAALLVFLPGAVREQPLGWTADERVRNVAEERVDRLRTEPLTVVACEEFLELIEDEQGRDETVAGPPESIVAPTNVFPQCSGRGLRRDFVAPPRGRLADRFEALLSQDRRHARSTAGCRRERCPPREAAERVPPSAATSCRDPRTPTTA